MHDIPTTVQMAIKSLKSLPLTFLTVHIGGGEEMLKYALSEVRSSLPETKILGVSFLTCLSEMDLLHIYGIKNPPEAFERLFRLASNCQLDGVICSPYEIEQVKAINPNLLAITPGIRFSDESALDQKRVASPKEAFQLGADYIVMGRSLTKAKSLADRLDQLSIAI